MPLPPPLDRWERDQGARAAARLVDQAAAALERGGTLDDVMPELAGALRRLTTAQRLAVAAALEGRSRREAEGPPPAQP